MYIRVMAVVFMACLLSSVPTAKAQSMTVDSVVEMVQAGVSDDVIIASLRKQGKAIDLGAVDLIRLKKAKVSDNVVKVMLDPAMPATPSTFSGAPRGPSPSQGAPARAPLNVGAVQAAVNQALAWTQKGGGVVVSGIQDLPAQNEAVVDLQFNDFQFNANGPSNTPKPRNEVTPPEPSVNSPDFYTRMASIPATERHVARYSGRGSAAIKHYTDGRSVLTTITFNFLTFNANIVIGSAPQAALNASPASANPGALAEDAATQAAADHMLKAIPAPERFTRSVGSFFGELKQKGMLSQQADIVNPHVIPQGFDAGAISSVVAVFEMRQATYECGSADTGAKSKSKRPSPLYSLSVKGMKQGQQWLVTEIKATGKDCSPTWQVKLALQ